VTSPPRTGRPVSAPAGGLHVAGLLGSLLLNPPPVSHRNSVAPEREAHPTGQVPPPRIPPEAAEDIPAPATDDTAETQQDTGGPAPHPHLSVGERVLADLLGLAPELQPTEP
jgi:hypothetical protein